jgi:AcrR family transcriptional regulator
VAEAAGTNKMTLYRHFASKDELVAECLRRSAAKAEVLWDRLQAEHPDDAKARLHAWVRAVTSDILDRDRRGCPLANAAVELAEKDHPARKVVEAFKRQQRDRLVRLCESAGLAEPRLAADQLFLVFEGARVCVQSLGADGLDVRLARLAEAIIATYDRGDSRADLPVDSGDDNFDK